MRPVNRPLCGRWCVGKVFLAGVGFALVGEDDAPEVVVGLVGLAADAVVVVVQEGDFHDPAVFRVDGDGLGGHFEEDVEFVQELDEVFADGGAEGVCLAVFSGKVKRMQKSGFLQAD